MADNTAGGKGTILLVEDDYAIAGMLQEVLEASGYLVLHAPTAGDGRAMVEQSRPDLIVLDLMLPDEDGLLLVSKLKAMDIPIVICSAADEKRERVLGLRLGADDYVTKPFDLDELEARVEAVLRRAHHTPREEGLPDQLRVQDLVIDRAKRRVTLGDRILQVTPTEYRLLSVLASRPNEVVSREEMAQQVWGYEDASAGRTIDVHVRRLRVKLASGLVPAPRITSVRGFGYKIDTESTEGEAESASEDEDETPDREGLEAVRHGRSRRAS